MAVTRPPFCTIHRAQASTVDVAHRREDGGGRSLAYVSMSRASETNTVHVVADDLDQAVEDLTRDWSIDRRARWAIDSGTPATQALDVERDQAASSALREALRLARLNAQPGATRYAATPEGQAARDLNTARSRRSVAERFADTADGWRMRRQWRKGAEEWADREVKAQNAYDEIVTPEAVRLDHDIHEIDAHRNELRTHQQDRSAWLSGHPDATSRLETIEHELDPFNEVPQIRQELSRLLAPRHEPLRPGVEHGPDLGIDIGL